MDIEFKETKRKRRGAMLLGILLAVIAGGAAFTMGSAKTTVADPLPTRNVVIAAVPIPARAVIDGSYLTMRSVPIDPSNANAITDPAMILGLTTGLDILQGQVITPNFFTTSDSSRPFAIVRPGESFGPDSPEWRAVAIDLEDMNAVGGLLVPGERVDLMASMFVNVVDPNANADNGGPVKGGPVTGLSTKVMMTDLELLAHPAESTLYVLKVDAHQAEEITYLQNQNPYFRGFAVSLRADGDSRTLPRDGYGVTGDRILLKYGFPLEQAIMGDRYPQPSPEPVVLDPTPAPVAAPTPMASPMPSAAPTPVASTGPVAPASSPSPAASASPAASTNP